MQNLGCVKIRGIGSREGKSRFSQTELNKHTRNFESFLFYCFLMQNYMSSKPRTSLYVHAKSQANPKNNYNTFKHLIRQTHVEKNMQLPQT